MKKMQKIFRIVLDFLFPPLCPICKTVVTENQTLCAKCFAKIHFIEKPYCKICGRPFEFEIQNEMICGACMQKGKAPRYNKGRSAFVYDATSKQLILPFKHSDHLELTPLLTKFLLRAGQDLFSETDIIIPVPLHYSRFLKRKYNQAEILSSALAKQLDKPTLSNILLRKRATKSQGHLSREARKKNIAGAFHIAHSDAIKGKTVLLVDDVMTTGATLNECTKLLKKAGAKQVFVLTLARVCKL